MNTGIYTGDAEFSAEVAQTLLSVLETKYFHHPESVSDNPVTNMRVHDVSPVAAELLQEYREYSAVLYVAQHYLQETLKQLSEIRKGSAEVSQ